MMYWVSRHGWHMSVSCEAFCVWYPAGQPISRNLPASTPDVDRTHVPGIGPLSAEQLRLGVRRAQKPPVAHVAPEGQLAHESVDPDDAR
jgi:hypothetical protein